MTSVLSRAQKEELRALIVAELARLDGVEAPELGADARGDRIDRVTSEIGRTSSSRMRARIDRRKLALGAALVRMDDDSYGICEQTGEAIPFLRLKADPAARTTAAAQEALEDESGVPDGDESPY